MILYTIRHKDTGELMPLMKKGKGYSHWNPGNKNAEELIGRTNLPRLIQCEKTALVIIGLWAANPNKCVREVPDSRSQLDWRINCKPDGRKKSDLEVVKVELKFES